MAIKTSIRSHFDKYTGGKKGWQKGMTAAGVIKAQNIDSKLRTIKKLSPESVQKLKQMSQQQQQTNMKMQPKKIASNSMKKAVKLPSKEKVMKSVAKTMGHKGC